MSGNAPACAINAADVLTESGRFGCLCGPGGPNGLNTNPKRRGVSHQPVWMRRHAPRSRVTPNIENPPALRANLIMKNTLAPGSGPELAKNHRKMTVLPRDPPGEGESRQKLEIVSSTARENYRSTIRPDLTCSDLSNEERTAER